MDNNLNKQEQISTGVVTMLLTGYVDTIKKLTMALIITVVCWLFTVCGFLYYLANYEVQVTNYGSFENSHVNTSTGQQADTMTNYYHNGVNDNGTNQK